MSASLQNLAATINGAQKRKTVAGEEVIEVSAPATTAASLYEKVRTVVDYQEEHLLRRNAILRIIKRYLGTGMVIEEMAVNLLKELIWAKYLPNKEVPASFAKKLMPVFAKYEPLLREADSLDNKEFIFSWLLDLLSTEIEYAISPPVADEAVVSYMYQEMLGRVIWDPKLDVSQEDAELRLYIAIHKTLLKSNNATLRFRIFTLYYPDWPGACSKEQIFEIRDNLERVIDLIEHQMGHPTTTRLSLLLRRKIGVFLAIRDMIHAKGEEFSNLINNPDALDREVAKVLKKRTKDFRSRLRRTVIRSVLFLFITKMLFALIIEVPYDLWFFGELEWFPLGVNVFFHPIFLAFIGMTVSIPEKKNTDDYKSAIRALVTGADHDELNIKMKFASFGAFSKFFSVVYILLFFAVYTGIGLFLYQFHFTLLSIILFLFFLSLVAFFGIRVRGSSKDIILSRSRSGLIGSFFDLIMLPIVRAGRWLSFKVSKINVFIYFFDFIIESPLKTAIRFAEGWFDYVREKKEEI